MDLENQESEVELSEEVEVVTDAIEEPIAEDFDADAEVTGEDALAILAGEDQAEEEAVEEEPAEEPKEEPVEDAVEDPVEDPVEAEAKEEAEDAEIMESITNERTRERFQSLSHKNKELIESSKQQMQVIDSFKDQVTSTGLSNEDFSQVIGLMGKANSTDINAVKEARAFIRDLDKTLTGRIGDTPNAYEKFDDLKQDYDNGEANEDYVNREAQRRIQDQVQNDHVQQQQQREAQQQQAQEQAVKEQGGAIQSMINQFKTSDPDFSLKEAQLENLAMKIVQDGVPMGQWATEFVNRYHSINVSQRKPSPTPMSSSRQAQNVNNFASSNVSDEQANIDFAMSLIR
jgi:hypothetical protein